MVRNNVDFNKFTLEIKASEGRLEVILNDGEANKVFDDIHMQKWGVFKNYFKAGNYLHSGVSNVSATVKYYNLEVSY